jgi:hypothetical protein
VIYLYFLGEMIIKMIALGVMGDGCYLQVRVGRDRTLQLSPRRLGTSWTASLSYLGKQPLVFSSFSHNSCEAIRKYQQKCHEPINSMYVVSMFHAQCIASDLPCA